METRRDYLEVRYAESCIDQVFIGLNDDAAEALFLFVVVPKVNATVYFYREQDAPAKSRGWDLQATVRPKR